MKVSRCFVGLKQFVGLWRGAQVECVVLQSCGSGKYLRHLDVFYWASLLWTHWLLIDSSATAAATDSWREGLAVACGSLSVFTTATGSHVNLCESFCVQPLLISLMDLTGLNQVSCNLKLYCSLQGNPLFSLPSAVRGEEFVRQGQLQSSAIGLRWGLRFCSRTPWRGGWCKGSLSVMLHHSVSLPKYQRNNLRLK